MRNDSADAVDPQFDVEQVDTDELLGDAEALAQIDASWHDESERTGLMEPRHVVSPRAPVIDGDWIQDSATSPDEFPREEDDDPHWDDEEMTVALDFERLAPWSAPGQIDGIVDDSIEAKWETAVTDKLERFERGPIAVFEADNRARTAAHSGGSEPIAPSQIPSLRPSRSSGVREILRQRDATPAVPRTTEVRQVTRPTPVPQAHRSAEPAWTPGDSTRRSLPARARPRTRVTPDNAVYQLHPPQPSAAPTRKLRPVPEAMRAPAPPPPPRLEAPKPAPPPRPVRASYAPERAYDAYANAAAPSARTGGYAAPTWPGQTSPQQPAAYPTAFAAAPALPTPRARTGAFAPVTSQNLPVLQSSAVDLSDLDVSFRPKRSLGLLWLGIAAVAAVALVFGIRMSIAPAPYSAAPVMPAAPAVQEDTGFSITTRPAGAQILVDGKGTGLITPARVRRLEAGLHSVDLKLPGYFDTSLPAALVEGKTLELEDVELRPLTAASEPVAAAPIPLESEVKAASPREARTPRRSARRLRKQAAEAEIGPYEQVAESTASAAPETLEAAPAEVATTDASGEGLLKINSRPWARVLVDDQFRGNTPQRALRLPAGKHVIRLVNEPMNMSKTLTVEIREGETLTKVETLEEEGAVAQGDALRDDPSL